MPLFLSLLYPLDGAEVETTAVRLAGATIPNATLTVGGAAAEVADDGSFFLDVVLEDGDNSIEVVATDDAGDTISQTVNVVSLATTEQLPFTLFYPPDGLTVSVSTVLVVGATRTDAVVAINGALVEVNSLGIFSSTVSLEEGSNLVEVVATDIGGNTRFETPVLFYEPQ